MSFLRTLVAPQQRHLTLSDEEVVAAIAGMRGGAGAQTANVVGRNALKNPNVWAAIRLTADALASMPATEYELDADGNPRAVPDQPQLLTEPSYDIEWGEWVYGTVAAMMSVGNFFSEAVLFDDVGVTQLEDFEPASITVREKFRDGTGPREPIGYWHQGTRIPNGRMAHMAAYRWPGTRVGLAPATYARQQIVLGILAERFGLDVYRRDGRVTGLLTSDQELNEEQAGEIYSMWVKSLKRGTVPVLGRGTKFERIQLSLEEAQALDVQRWNAEQTARVFGVPPEMLSIAASGQSVTYANRSQAVTHWHQTSLSSWQRRIENRITKLRDPGRQSGRYVKLNPGGLLRADTKERYETYAIGLREKFLHVDEVRAWEELAPRDDLGEAVPEGAMEIVTDDDGNPTGIVPLRALP